MSYFLQHKHSNLWHGKFSVFPENLVIHAISSRQGGKSQKPYGSLNLGLHVDDDPETVWENRLLFASSLGLRAEDIVTPQQIHGAQVVRVYAEDAGRGARCYGEAVPETDALITNVPGLPLMLCFADCTPIMFFDPEHGAAGIAHGGWKGTVARIAKLTIEAMQKEFHTNPLECLAGIGPSIGPCCYEIGSEVAEKFRQAFPLSIERILLFKNGKIYLNLWEANRIQLLEAGMKEENIELSNTCTSCENSWYFSYRADGKKTGRIAAMIAVRKY